MVTDVMDYLEPDFKRKKLLSAIKDKIANLHEDEVLAFSKFCGPIIQKLIPFMDKSPHVLSNFLSYFRDLASWKNKAIRANFLYNLPGVLRLTDQKYFLTLKTPYLKLFNDKNPDVRATLYASLHHVLASIDDEDTSITVRKLLVISLKEENEPEMLEIFSNVLPELFSVLFEDPALDGQCSLQIESFPELHQTFEWINPIFSTPIYNEIQKEDLELISCIPILWKKIAKSNNWRMECEFISQIGKCTGIISPNSFIAFCLLEAWTRMKTGSRQVRSACIELVIMTMKEYFRRDIVKFIMKQMNAQFHKASSSKERITFLEFCERCIEEFSREFARNYLVQSLLETANEKKMNVRLVFLKLLPDFRTILTEEDAGAIEQINHLISNWLGSSNSKIIRELLLRAKDTIRYRLTSKDFILETENKDKMKKMAEDDKINDEMKEIEEIKRKNMEELTKESIDSTKSSKNSVGLFNFALKPFKFKKTEKKDINRSWFREKNPKYQENQQHSCSGIEGRCKLPQSLNAELPPKHKLQTVKISESTHFKVKKEFGR